MNAVFGAPMAAGPTRGAVVCVNAGVVIAAANVTDKKKSRRSIFISPVHGFAGQVLG
jgi:hypothetical protein